MHVQEGIMGMRRRWWWAAALSAAALGAVQLGGCATVTEGPGYYWQSMVGHLSMMSRARPIQEVLQDSGTDARLRERLERAIEIRRFASRELALPDNESYTRYADLQRPFVVWNVFATPELSMRLQRWCFPVAGCVSYRGYYEKAEAERFAERLRDMGLDVQVGGVPAYSTLGWFADPVLSTFIQYSEGDLARLIFHELAHQVVYVKGDTTFNESFATAVEEVGVERWLEARNDPALQKAYRAHVERRREFVELLRRHRAALEYLYAQPLSDDDKRAGKQQVFAELKDEYQVLRASWGGFAGFDRWFSQPLTNAHLAAVGTYTDLLPAFRALLRQQDGDLARFYAATRELAAMSRSERNTQLSGLVRIVVKNDSRSVYVNDDEPSKSTRERTGFTPP
jgi:predicted aminopeptidase